MIEDSLGRVHAKFRLNFYRQIFKRFEQKEGALTAIETFCIEVIHALSLPTVNQFAEFLQISQANAAYKVGKLVEKGYINKIQSKKDKREFHLEVTEKFLNYYNISSDFVKTVAERIYKRFSKIDLEKLEEFLNIISEELIPEVVLEGAN